MTSIVLAEDHLVVRQGLKVLLEAEPDFRLIGESGDGLETAQLVERLGPDVLIVDLMMPGLSGLEVTRQVSQRSPHTRVVILSMHANEAYVLEALRNGAAAYVLKDSSAAGLVHAVREVVAGRRYLSPPLSERAIEVYTKKAEVAVLDPYETLTPREREVLDLVATGLTSAAIGERLSISRRTVEVHRANVMQKLGVSSPAEMVRYAVERGHLPAATAAPSDEDPGD